MKRSNFHGIFSIERSTRRLKKKERKEKEIQSTVRTRLDNIRGGARSYVVEYRHKDDGIPGGNREKSRNPAESRADRIW